MSSVMSFAYLAHFSKLNVFGTNADISKRQTVFVFLCKILCDKRNKRGGRGGGGEI